MKAHNYYFYLINKTALIRMEKLEYNPDALNYLFSHKKSAKRYLPYSDMDTLIGNILPN